MVEEEIPTSMKDVDFSEQLQQGAERWRRILRENLRTAEKFVTFFVDLSNAVRAVSLCSRRAQFVRGVRHLLLRQ